MPLNYRVVARAKDTGELYLYDDIGGDDWFGGGVSSKQVIEDIAALGAIKTLNVRINSAGGSVFEGLAIYNALTRCEARVEVDIDSLAGSIASIIAMAGKEIRMAANATMMIHDPMGMAMGTADDMRQAADMLEGVRGTLVKTYAARTGNEEQEVSDWMKAETWMDAQTCLDRGFCDSVSQPLQMAAHGDLSRFRNVPARVRAAAQPRPRADLQAVRISEMKQRAQSIATAASGTTG